MSGNKSTCAKSRVIILRGSTLMFAYFFNTIIGCILISLSYAVRGAVIDRTHLLAMNATPTTKHNTALGLCACQNLA
jgi:hypothetical protein